MAGAGLEKIRNSVQIPVFRRNAGNAGSGVELVELAAKRKSATDLQMM